MRPSRYNVVGLCSRLRASHEATGIVTLMCSAAVAWPATAPAQQPSMPVVGYLSGASATKVEHFTAAFRQGLSHTGYVEGRNVISNIVGRMSTTSGCQRWRMSCSPAGRCARRKRRGSIRFRCQALDRYDTNRLHRGWRSSGKRSRREPQSAGRQRHRRAPFPRRSSDCKANRISGRACSERDRDRVL